MNWDPSPFVSGSARRFFEFCARDSTRARRTIIAIVGRPCVLSFRDLVLFFFFDLRSANLEPRFKFQRASRPKEED